MLRMNTRMHAYPCRHHQKVEPASHGSNDPGNDSNTELSKEGIKGHKEELKNMQVCYSHLGFCVSAIHTPKLTVLSVPNGIHVLQNQAAKYDTSATGPLDKNGPPQSMTDMKTQRKQ